MNVEMKIGGKYYDSISRLFLSLLLLLSYYNAIDIYQTYLLFDLGCGELNPLTHFVIQKFSIVGIIFVKFFFILLLGIFSLLYIEKEIKKIEDRR
jgi:hypothetical protein